MSVHRNIRPSFKIIIFTLLWIHAYADDSKLSEHMKKMKAAKDKVLNGYDKTIRPTSKDSNLTRVQVSFIPRQILNVDEEKGIFELDSFLFLRWKDERLVWDLKEYNGYLNMPTDLVWTPDVNIFNSHSAPVDPKQNVVLLYFQNGTVHWIPPMHTSTSCPSLLNVTYPGDVVTCGVQMGYWAHLGFEVDLYHEPDIWPEEFVDIHSRWEMKVSEVSVVHNTADYRDDNETFSFLEVHFPIRRKPMPEIEVTRSPCILVMLLALAMFWMPPDSPNKLMLGGISVLSLLILLIYVAGSTKFPLGVLFRVSFLQSTLYIVVASVLLQVLVIFNLCNIAGPARPPAAIMQLLSGPLGKYTCLRSTPSNDNTGRLQLKEDSQNFIKQPTPNEDWLLFASGLDRLFFVLVSISMIAIHHL